MAGKSKRNNSYRIIFKVKGRKPVEHTFPVTDFPPPPEGQKYAPEFLEFKKELEQGFADGSFDPFTEKYSLKSTPSELLSDIVDKYISYKSRGDWKPNTAKKMQGELNGFVKYMGNCHVNALTIEMINEWINRENLSLGSRKSYTRMMKAFCKYVGLDDSRLYISKDVENKSDHISFYTPEQKQLMIECAKDFFGGRRRIKFGFQDFKDFINWQHYSGMRLNETLGIKASDYHKDSGIVHIQRKGSKNNPYKRMAIDISHINILTEIANRRLSMYEELFTLSQTSISNYHKKIRQIAIPEQPDLNIHSWRHTCAMDLLKAGADLYTIKEWLGHSSINTTMGYAKMNTSMTGKAVGEIFGSRMFKV